MLLSEGTVGGDSGR